MAETPPAPNKRVNLMRRSADIDWYGVAHRLRAHRCAQRAGMARSRFTIRWLSALALLLAAAYGLAACADDSATSTPSATPSQAAAIPLACVVGDAGAILVTTDGVSWTQRLSGTQATLLGMAFADAHSGFSVGADGTVLHTPDGGMTWAAQTSGLEGTERSLLSVACRTASEACIVGAGTALSTDDGGAHWQSAKAVVGAGPSPAGSFAVEFVDARRGWAVGGREILGTSDGGLHWTTQHHETSGRSALLFNRVAACDTGLVWAAGSAGAEMSPGETQAAVLASDDGHTWQRQLKTTEVGIDDLCCTDADHVWALAGEDLYRSVDGGAHWQRVRGAGGNRLAFADAATGWRVNEEARGCVIYGTTDGGRTWQRQATIDPDVMPYVGDIAVLR